MSKLLRFAALTAVLCSMLPASADDIPLADRKSGYALMGREIQTMQDDDSANPGMLSVLDGEALWNKKAGVAEKSCADCHGDARASMRGVAARYPAYHAARARPIDLEQRINLCRVDQQIATPLQYESKELLALAAYVGRQSRGMPLQPTDERLRPFIEAGRESFNRRQGQINLSCAQCHDERWGKRLAGSVIPQGHATGLSALPPGMAGARVAAAPAAQLPDRHACGALSARGAGICRSSALSDVARPRPGRRDAGRAPLSRQTRGNSPRLSQLRAHRSR